MTKEELDSKLDRWKATSPKGSGKRYYSKPHPELDGELEYTIRRATIINSKPVAHEKKLLIDSLTDQLAKNNNSDLDKLTSLLESFDTEYQTILDKKQ